MCEPETSIAVAVVRQSGRVLIGQRPPGVPLAGFWEFPGGKVRPGEPPEEAAVRECREEAGLEIRVEGPCEEVVFPYPHGRLRIRFFLARPAGDSTAAWAPFCWVALIGTGRVSFSAGQPVRAPPPAGGRLERGGLSDEW